MLSAAGVLEWPCCHCVQVLNSANVEGSVRPMCDRCDENVPPSLVPETAAPGAFYWLSTVD